MDLFENKGFRFKNENFAIDPFNKKEKINSIVTHAHLDHAGYSNDSKVFATKETLCLLDTVYKTPIESKQLTFGKKIKFENSQISLHDSGHIMGSSQVLIENGTSLAFTSDFKAENSIVQKGATQLKADILAIETTFGLPSFNFPPREKVYEEMANWVKQQLSFNNFVILSGYALGKAQELTKFCNDFLGIAPLVHEKIFENNKVYEKNNHKLGTYYKLNHNLNDSNILIMPPTLVNQHMLYALQFSMNKKISSAIATGWFYRKGHNKLFLLSDHADFDELLTYVENSEAKLVLTMHGYQKEFSRYVERRLKIPSRPINTVGKKQKVLVEFV